MNINRTDSLTTASKNLYKSTQVEKTERQPSSFADDSRIGITPIISGKAVTRVDFGGPEDR